MKRYKVETVFIRSETFTSYVWAENEEQAEAQADEEMESGLEGEMDGISRDVEFKVLDPDAPHEIVHGSSYEPERFNERICLVCDRKLVWTGQNHDDPRNTTGKTIPGPWVHEAEASEAFYRPQDWPVKHV